ncbi:MAG: substrate-binding domain-containing protein [Spirochaetales bacterium]|nr:substrate-binding domain-containing protein [Spirochaetales bacterium]
MKDGLNKRPVFAVLADYLDLEFNNKALNGITDFVKEKGINVICLVGGNLESPYSWERNRNILFRLPDDKTVDGIIVLSSLIGQYVSPEEFGKFCRGFHGLPVVTVSEWIEGLPAVLIDNESGMNELLTHLIDHHRISRFAIIRGPKGIPDAEERFQTCIMSLRKHNIPVNTDAIIEAPFGITSGIWAVEQLLDRNKAEFEAIIAPNDHTALGAMKALQMRGIRIPEDVAVVGFDDISESRFSFPALTTISQPIYDLGKASAGILYDIIRGADSSVPIRTLPTQLVVRESCGCHLHDCTTEEAPIADPVDVREPFDVVFSRNREMIQADLINTLLELNPVRKAPFFRNIDLILNSFSLAVKERKSENFLRVWEEISRQLLEEGYTPFIFASLLTRLRKHMLKCITDYRNLLFAEDVFFQAISKTSYQSTETQITDYVVQHSMVTRLNAFFGTLGMARDIEQQVHIMQMGIPPLNFKSFFLVLYDQQEDAGPEKEILSGRIVLGCQDDKCIISMKESKNLPFNDIFPKGILPHCGEFIFVVEALFLGNDQIGFFVIGLKNFSHSFSEDIRTQLSTVLRNTILLDRIKTLTNNLHRLAEGKNNDMAKINQSLRREVKKMQDILTGNESTISPDAGEDIRIQKALHYIEANYNNDISLDELAENVFMNPVYFSNFFKAKTGTGFLEYLTSLRVEKALKLLSNPQLTVKEIAAMVGYKDANYFGKIVKKYTNLLPTEYRQKVLTGRETRDLTKECQ